MKKNLHAQKTFRYLIFNPKIFLILLVFAGKSELLKAQKIHYPLSISSKDYKPAQTQSKITTLKHPVNLSPTAGTWTALTNSPAFVCGGGMLLLSDGTVLCKSYGGGTDGIGNIYTRLTPDASGSYINGTWSSIAPMNNTRLYYSSQVLKDGRVYVAGGEYGSGLAHGEVYDPLTNVWTLTPDPGTNVSDANSEILEDGRVLQNLIGGDFLHNVIYDPSTNTYSPGPSTLDYANESAWLKLPDNSILYVDMTIGGDDHSTERYIPATNSWIADANIPVSIYDPYGFEAGGAFLLPDGRGFFLGATGHTAYYTPSGSTSNGTWAAGPDIPNSQGTPDAAAAMMVNGKILCAVSPLPTSGNHFPSPTSFYEFDYLTNSFTQVSAPGGGTTNNNGCYITNMIDLPDGSVLFANQGTSQYYIYTPSGTPLTTGKPVITGITQTGSNTYSLTGTGFNGISEGASYGDDWQMSTNYPIARLTSGSNVYYCRTSNWNSTGVQRGNAPDSVTLTLPAGLPDGSYSLVVTANGIASDPVSFATGCQPPINTSVLSLTSTSAVLNWESGSGSSVTNYKLSYKVGTASTFTTVPVHHLPYILTGLSANTVYKFKVQSVCTGNTKSDYTALSSFKTLHNGNVSYCTTKGVTAYEYINKIAIGSINNLSGDNSGYGDYSGLSTDIAVGSSPSIRLTPGFQGSAYDEYWEVYIDYNHNGWFEDAGEKVATGHKNAALTKTFTVPLTATLGTTRMRAVMHYGGYLGSTCGDFSDGEAEDYTVNITGSGFAGIAPDASEASVASSIIIVPNPIKSYSATAILNLTKQGSTSLRITDLTGRVLYEINCTNLHTGKNTIDLKDLKISNGVFVIVAMQENAIIARSQIQVSR
ncbi:MAG: fibronectin type III domain-containing protein [Parafilimonas sp.]|nr:fibronectin type III domain-containing protein [Parafilimonas sp.]